MTLTLSPEQGTIFRLDVTGVLREADLTRSQADLAAEIARKGSARLLVVLNRFEGWDTASNWSDLGFYMAYGDRIERIAIVGDERWKSHMLMFAAADLRRAPVRYFREDEMAQARAWLLQ